MEAITNWPQAFTIVGVVACIVCVFITAIILR